MAANDNREINIYAYTDGSCYGNAGKQKDRKCGYGIYYEQPNELGLTKSMGKIEKNMSNSRSELMSLLVCLEEVLNSTIGTGYTVNLHVYIDSMYALNSADKWIYKWEKENYKDRAHQDILRSLYDVINRINGGYAMNVEYIKVKAHKSAPRDKESEEYRLWYGNDRADNLAKYGATRQNTNEHSGFMNNTIKSLISNCEDDILQELDSGIIESKKELSELMKMI